MSQQWTEANTPDLSGKVVLITGANSGTGFESSRVMAGQGATVIMACRSQDKAQDAADSIRAQHPDADLHLFSLNLASLASVRQFATAFQAKFNQLDLLLNNAGIMALPQSLTEDGFELQIGTNHFGHFLLTALLMDRLRATEQSRIVTVSSLVHHYGKLMIDDLNFENRRYNRWISYAQSKLANLSFGLELHRRLQASGSQVQSVVAHPGISATNLMAKDGMTTGFSSFGKLNQGFVRLIGQTAEQGAWPIIYAAVEPTVASGDYCGPDGFQEIAGHPNNRSKISRAARDQQLAEKLWNTSEQLVEERFSV